MIIDSSKLREREVVNVCDGKNLGYVCDFLIDTECGKICAVFVSDHIFSIATSKNSKKIPWEKIKCIGEDTILVEIGDGDCGCDCEKTGKRERKRCGWLF